jgi:hypothetical protein
MHGPNNVSINGNARIIDNDHINITLSIEDLEAIKRNKTKDFLTFHIKRRIKRDVFGNTHLIVNGHYKVVDPKDETQPPHVDNRGKSTLDI